MFLSVAHPGLLLTLVLHLHSMTFFVRVTMWTRKARMVQMTTFYFSVCGYWHDDTEKEWGWIFSCSESAGAGIINPRRAFAGLASDSQLALAAVTLRDPCRFICIKQPEPRFSPLVFFARLLSVTLALPCRKWLLPDRPRQMTTVNINVT